jgi:HlyD family secretion protein
MKKILILLIIVLPILMVGFVLLWSLGFFAEAQSVELVAVSRAALNRSVATNGKIEAEKVIELRAPLSGICRRMDASDGARLKKGRAILQLEDPSLAPSLAAAQAEYESAQLDLRDVQRGPTQEELSRAEAEVARARLAVEHAHKLLDANEWLLARDAIPRIEVERNRQSLTEAEQTLAAAESQMASLKNRYGAPDLRRAQSRIEAAGARLQYLKESRERMLVRAPADGTLYQFEVKDGAFLNTGDLIGLFADLTRLRLKAYVDEPDIGQVEVGEKIRIRWDARPQDEWSGVVAAMPAQVVTLGTRSVAEVLCRIDNPGSTLLTNVNVDVEIEVPEGPAVASLPRSVVFPDGKREFVWIIERDKAVKRYVETGRSTNARIEITGGLALGDKVIDPGDRPMSEGLKVQAATTR